MADLPHPWRAYACLQSELSDRSKLDAYTWGVEAGLDRYVLADHDDAPPPIEIARARAAATRRERSRARWRALGLAPTLIKAYEPEPGLVARSELGAVQSRTTAEEWGLLNRVARGDEYADMARIDGASAAALRVTVTRTRARLRVFLTSSLPDQSPTTLPSVQ